MTLKKSSKISLFISFLIVAFVMSGCYTQFSRPNVETDYYSGYEEDYEYEYDQHGYEDTDDMYYYNVNVYAGTPVYYGPHAWEYWSPYYRWHRYHHGYYDPWIYGRNYFHVGIYDPFYDPWYDTWAYQNYYYYHPRNHYYRSFDGNRNYWQPKERVQRDFSRRDAYPTKRIIKKRKLTPAEKVKQHVTQQVKTNDREAVSRRKSTETVRRTKPDQSVRKAPQATRPKKTTTSPQVTRRKKSETPSQPKRVRRPTTTRSKSSSYSRPSSSSSKPKYRAPATRKSSSSEQRSSSGSSSSRSKSKSSSSSSSSSKKSKK